MKNIMKEAHNLTKRILKAGDSYRATFRICLSFVHSQIKKEVVKMVELAGSEKQIAWAKNIRKEVNTILVTIKEADIKRKQRKNKDFSISSKKVDEVIETINSTKESKFFIENFKNVLNCDKEESFYNFYYVIRDTQMFGKLSAIATFALKEIF